MTRNTFKNILLAVAALLAFNSCLEKKPGDYLPLEEGMNSVTAAEEIVNGIYKTLMSGSLYSACIPLCPDIQADLVHAVKGNSNTYVKIWQWDIQAGDANVEAVYSGLYRVIGQCNYFLENVDALKDRLTDDGQILQLDALTGETYFCRALAYSELIKFFCKAYEPDSAADELGVVLALAYSGEKPSRRSDLKSSYGQVLSDLAAADALLDPDYDVANSIYVRNAAVHALWARTALYMQDWDEAVNHSSRVIESGVYSLADANSRYSSDQTFLEYLWSGDASYEIIFKLGYTSTSYGAATGSVFLNFT
ncbi:MAG: RagB/SusD family nutrient uptake outer membrane protein, partial [Candidatus Cryptobacteroides sp.]